MFRFQFIFRDVYTATSLHLLCDLTCQSIYLLTQVQHSSTECLCLSSTLRLKGCFFFFLFISYSHIQSSTCPIRPNSEDASSMKPSLNLPSKLNVLLWTHRRFLVHRFTNKVGPLNVFIPFCFMHLPWSGSISLSHSASYTTLHLMGP